MVFGALIVPNVLWVLIVLFVLTVLIVLFVPSFTLPREVLSDIFP